MDAYYHQIDRLAFQHQILFVTKEMQFRLRELIDASRAELLDFHEAVKHKRPLDETKQTRLRYRFSSVVALLQTFRDALRGALGKDCNFSSLTEGVPHAILLRQLRNALVHDGYQPVGMWVDGRYYIPVNFRRLDQHQKAVFVDAPTADVETLTLEFAACYCGRLAELIETLAPVAKLQGTKLPYEWFLAAASHPALVKFQLPELPSRDDWLKSCENEAPPLDEAALKLREIRDLCRSRLAELQALPNVPFP